MDMQVSVEEDARKLARVAPAARLAILPNMAHTLKDERTELQPSYFDPTISLARGVVDAVASLCQGPTPSYEP
jgi:hypothetical protein